MKLIFIFFILILSTPVFSQQLGSLTIEKIMRDPKWIGVSPSNIHWSADSKKVYFTWNPENMERGSLYTITPGSIKPVKVNIEEEKQSAPIGGNWNKNQTLKVYEKYGDIWLYSLRNGSTMRLTNTVDRESGPSFIGNEKSIVFKKGNNLFQLKLDGTELVQFTNFVSKSSAEHPEHLNEQEQWLKKQQGRTI